MFQSRAGLFNQRHDMSNRGIRALPQPRKQRLGMFFLQQGPIGEPLKEFRQVVWNVKLDSFAQVLVETVKFTQAYWIVISQMQ